MAWRDVRCDSQVEAEAEWMTMRFDGELLNEAEGAKDIERWIQARATSHPRAPARPARERGANPSPTMCRALQSHEVEGAGI